MHSPLIPSSRPRSSFPGCSIGNASIALLRWRQQVPDGGYFLNILATSSQIFRAFFSGFSFKASLPTPRHTSCFCRSSTMLTARMPTSWTRGYTPYCASHQPQPGPQYGPQPGPGPPYQPQVGATNG